MVSEINGSHPSQPQAWSHPVDAYLASNNIHYARATPLQGGYSAYVWRVDGYNDDPSPSPSSTASFSEPCVLKYADDAAKCVPGMALDPTRMRFEARALESEAVKSACAAEPGVQVPKVLRETERALLMTWGGELSLKETLVEGGEIDGENVGARLGRWLACMHRAGVNDAEAREWESSSFMDPVKRNEYARLHEAMLANGFGEGGFHEVVERLEQPAGLETVTAWDFRPSNTLLRVEDYPEGEPGITIIDWEANAYGCPVWDVGLWVTETIVLVAKHCGNETLVPSFLASYGQNAGRGIITDEFMAKLALLVGSSLNYFVPRGFWDSTTEEVAFWRHRAIQYICAGLDRDLAWISVSELGPLCKGAAFDLDCD